MSTAPKASTAGVIDFGRQFGGRNSAPDAVREDAQIWLNIGYYIDVPVAGVDGAEDTIEQRFISLPVGIALDNMEPVKLGNNENFNNFQSARNDLLAQLKAASAGLAPGEEQTLTLDVQVRRVKPKAEATATENNPFAAKLDLFAKK